MAEPTLQQVFGTNATQSATTITIAKADLADTGLTASANNTAESLMTALIKKGSQYLNEVNQALNSDIQILIADSEFPAIIQRNNQQYRQTTYNIDFQKIDTSAGLDPDDF